LDVSLGLRRFRRCGWSFVFCFRCFVLLLAGVLRVVQVAGGAAVGFDLGYIF
jgi:hypothetical protein